jgi:hypothetical protein
MHGIKPHRAAATSKLEAKKKSGSGTYAWPLQWGGEPNQKRKRTPSEYNVSKYLTWRV